LAAAWLTEGACLPPKERKREVRLPHPRFLDSATDLPQPNPRPGVTGVPVRNAETTPSCSRPQGAALRQEPPVVIRHGERLAVEETELAPEVGVRVERQRAAVAYGVAGLVVIVGMLLGLRVLRSFGSCGA